MAHFLETTANRTLVKPKRANRPWKISGFQNIYHFITTRAVPFVGHCQNEQLHSALAMLTTLPAVRCCICDVTGCDKGAGHPVDMPLMMDSMDNPTGLPADSTSTWTTLLLAPHLKE